MSSYLLGISCFYHDSAAALLCDGEIVAAAQEERFSRKLKQMSILERETITAAGILTQIPHEFFIKQVKKQGFVLPDSGEYGVGVFFFPKESENSEKIKKLIETESNKLGIRLLGWREVPVNNSSLSKDKEILNSKGLTM